MSEEKIPAWKRVGLKHSKKTVSQAKDAYDPLKEGLKRAGDSDKKPAKPAKRAKVAKADKPAPTHELDQLAYLRQYTENRDQWKFSKQKQNWLLKHIFEEIISEKYEPALINYIEGLQGSARCWVLEDSLDVVKRWNEFMTADLLNNSDESGKTINADLQNEKKEDSGSNIESGEKENEEKASKLPEANGKDGENKKTGKTKKGKPEPVPQIPSQTMVLRAQKLVRSLGEECPKLELLDREAVAPGSA